MSKRNSLSLKISGSGRKLHLGAGLFVGPEGTPPFHRAQRLAAGILLAPFVAVPAHNGRQLHGQGIHAGYPDPVQPARHLIGILVELAAGMQRRHHHFQRRAFLLGMLLHGNAAPVVDDTHGAVFIDGHLDPIAVPGQRLVDRIVHYLVHQMVQSPEPQISYVHRGALADGFQSLEYLDVFGGRSRSHLRSQSRSRVRNRSRLQSQSRSRPVFTG